MRCDLSDSLRITRKGAGTDCCTVSTAKKSKCPEETAGIGFETTVCSAPETACVLQLHPASLPANAEKENINREKNRMTDVFIPWKMTLRIYDKLNSITNNRRRYFSSPPPLIPADGGRKSLLSDSLPGSGKRIVPITEYFYTKSGPKGAARTTFWCQKFCYPRHRKF